jgi:hypothetical protein
MLLVQKLDTNLLFLGSVLLGLCGCVRLVVVLALILALVLALVLIFVL